MKVCFETILTPFELTEKIDRIFKSLLPVNWRAWNARLEEEETKKFHNKRVKLKGRHSSIHWNAGKKNVLN